MNWHELKRTAVYLSALITLGSPVVARAQRINSVDLVRKCVRLNRPLTVKEAGRGDVFKDFCAGLFYETGHDGVPKDISAAMHYYRLSADAGFAPGQLAVGYLYAGESNYVLAKSWFEKAVSQDYADAQWALGNLYFNGNGVTKSRAEAMKWYRLAAAGGSADAKALLARIDAGFDPARQEPAQDLMAEADRIWKSGDHAAAARPYLAAARAGNSLAQLQIGWHYEKGVGVPQSFKEAALWYRKAADQGLASAMTNLGNLYELGEGVPEDWVESAKWRLKSAQLGDSGGQSALGAAYEFGIGLPQNRKLAIQWDQEAAAQGNAQSAYYAKWLSNPGNFIGFRNAKERSLFPAMPDSPIFAEPKGAIFHNSAERLRYLSNAAQSAPSASGISTWHTVCDNGYCAGSKEAWNRAKELGKIAPYGVPPGSPDH